MEVSLADRRSIEVGSYYWFKGVFMKYMPLRDEKCTMEELLSVCSLYLNDIIKEKNNG